jgi:hypothetical protein
MVNQESGVKSRESGVKHREGAQKMGFSNRFWDFRRANQIPETGFQAILQGESLCEALYGLSYIFNGLQD